MESTARYNRAGFEYCNTKDEHLLHPLWDDTHNYFLFYHPDYGQVFIKDYHKGKFFDVDYVTDDWFKRVVWYTQTVIADKILTNSHPVVDGIDNTVNEVLTNQKDAWDIFFTTLDEMGIVGNKAWCFESLKMELEWFYASV